MTEALNPERSEIMPPLLAVAFGGALLAAAKLRGPLACGALAAAGGALLYKGLARPVPTPSDRRPSFARGIRVKKSVTVGQSPADCYAYWRNLENLPRIMDHLESVRVISGRRSHWVARGGLNGVVEWDAEIVRDEPGQIIGWRSTPGSMVDTAGSVRFRATPQGGTRTEVKLKYNPPAGAVGATVLALFADQPGREIETGLERFKTLMEQQVRREAALDTVVEDSFPASDPPAWTATGV